MIMANNEKSEIIDALEQAKRDIANLIDALKTGEGRVDTLDFISGDLDRVNEMIIGLEE